MNIAVFASHGGSDMQAIADGCKNNKINAKVAVVISNNGDSMALQRARNENIPALLPKFGGKGMYGMNVHTAVIEAKERKTGVTIHRVNAEYDSGEIVAQTTVPVLEGDTPEILAARVLECEHKFLVEVISDIAKGKIILG